ncbi:acyl-CoA thioesterase [Pelagicoccus sp. NFK12]|uniref:Acyl-CoA thioesterase n=1 Tax=Pelagicoccus enzymogenes TaxID=2773457 RepID=A0A927F9I3_9BACT|nr:thioesterase family protein [Pelagicoccus enzymogenes]MBD5780340.1 acyl-CoA thioesterase [Pelagicoccus enzymogenes]MDQ8197757.1 thioesterase family protein [Pelagicoccus enzymogenes]
MAFDYVLERELAFNETDMAGIAHFSNFFRWMEVAEHGFLKSLGVDPVVQDRDKFWGWPRVRASCEYHSPLRYGDCFEVHLFVKEIKQKSVVYFFRIRKREADGSYIAVARAEMTSVYAGFDVPSQSMAALDLEQDLLGKLEEAPAELMKSARNQRPA